MTAGEIILLVIFIIVCMLNYIGNKLTKENIKIQKEIIQKLDISNELRRKIYIEIQK